MFTATLHFASFSLILIRSNNSTYHHISLYCSRHPSRFLLTLFTNAFYTHSAFSVDFESPHFYVIPTSIFCDGKDGETGREVHVLFEEAYTERS